MSVSKETLRAMIHDLGLIQLSEGELDAVLPELETQLAVLAKIRNLDFSKTPSARQINTVRDVLKRRLEGKTDEK